MVKDATNVLVAALTTRLVYVGTIFRTFTFLFLVTGLYLVCYGKEG